MASPMTSPRPTPSTSASTAAPPRPLLLPALVAGIGTLLLAVLSGWANFAVVEALVTEANASRTAQAILASEATFRLGVVALFGAAVLDLVVAWALRAFFTPAHRRLSTVAAWLRTLYAAIFAIAITQLAAALDVLNNTASSTTLSPHQLEVEALRRIESFHLIWDIGLVLFGLHLIAIGYLALRATYVPRLVGWLVAVAGSGYVVDSGVALLAPGSLPEVALVTFVGEVLLLGWLLVRGRRVTLTELHATSPQHP